MTLIGLLVALVVIILLFWALGALLPETKLPAGIQKIFYVIAVILVVLWLVNYVFPGQLPSFLVIGLWRL